MYRSSNVKPSCPVSFLTRSKTLSDIFCICVRLHCLPVHHISSLKSLGHQMSMSYNTIKISLARNRQYTSNWQKKAI